MMPDLDWSKCEAVESIPGKVSGAWVFKGTRMPVWVVFDNIEAGASMAEIMDWFHVTQEQFVAVVNFVRQSLESAPHLPRPVSDLARPTSELVDAHSL